MLASVLWQLLWLLSLVPLPPLLLAAGRRGLGGRGRKEGGEEGGGGGGGLEGGNGKMERRKIGRRGKTGERRERKSTDIALLPLIAGASPKWRVGELGNEANSAAQVESHVCMCLLGPYMYICWVRTCTYVK